MLGLRVRFGREGWWVLLLRHEVRPCEKVLALLRRIEAREGVGGLGENGGGGGDGNGN